MINVKAFDLKRFSNKAENDGSLLKLNAKIIYAVAEYIKASILLFVWFVNEATISEL